MHKDIANWMKDLLKGMGSEGWPVASSQEVLLKLMPRSLHKELLELAKFPKAVSTATKPRHPQSYQRSRAWPQSIQQGGVAIVIRGWEESGLRSIQRPSCMETGTHLTVMGAGTSKGVQQQCRGSGWIMMQQAKSKPPKAGAQAEPPTPACISLTHIHHRHPRHHPYTHSRR